MEITGIIFKNGDIIVTSNITKIVPDDYNDPDIEISYPYKIEKTVADSFYLTPYLGRYTNQLIFSFRSDDVFTFFNPNENIAEDYKRLTNAEEQLKLNINVPETTEEEYWNFIPM